MRFWKYRDREEVVSADGQVHHVGPSDADVKDAYDRGRRDERAGRKRHPILALIVVLVAIVGGVMLFLAVREGSFSRAGQVADQQLAVAKAEAPGVIATAGENVSEAAQDVKAKVTKDDSAAAPSDANR
jgi:hypothetical protein